MNKRKTIWSSLTSIIASVLAFLGVVSCCGMPIIAGLLATLGIGASQLSFFAEYRGWFIAFAIISLIYGFYQAYFKKKSCCCSETTSEQPKESNSIIPKVFLWIGTIITLFALFMQTPEEETSQTSSCCPIQKTECCDTLIATEENASKDSIEQKNTSCCPSTTNNSK